MEKKLNFLICSVPRMAMYYPPPAPAFLKSILLKAGHTCKTIDFVSDFFYSFQKHPRWTEIDNWNALANYQNKEIETLIEEKVEDWAKKILEYNANWVGISIFSYESHRIGKLIVEKIKMLDPTQKILMGGTGITNVSEPYAEKLLEKGLINAYITGEGEETILEFAKNNFDFPGINNKNFINVSKKVLDNMPEADYSDYNLKLYGKENLGIYLRTSNHTLKDMTETENTMSITGSKGCVRKCSYCDVPYVWPKFIHRSGDIVANEIIEKSKKYGVRRFHFTDSLVNGSMKEFRIMCDILAKHNVDNNANIVWNGQFIFRPIKQHTPEDWELIARSGASVLEVGIESASDEIRFQMGKKFTNDDVAYELEQCSKHKITTWPLFIIGYPTETEKHVNEYKKFFERFHPYAYDKTILNLELGGTLRIQPNTPDYTNLPKMGVEFIPMPNGAREDMLWWNPANPTLTLSERIRRRLMLGKVAKNLGYSIPSEEKDLKFLWSKWNQLKDIEKECLDARKNKN